MSNTEPSDTKDDSTSSPATTRITSQGATGGNSNVNTTSDALLSRLLDRMQRIEEKYDQVMRENMGLRGAQQRDSLRRRVSMGTSDFNELIDPEPTAITEPVLSPTS